jgi:D-serine deaminase-like pyridoxal phosphate-dependent protein
MSRPKTARSPTRPEGARLRLGSPLVCDEPAATTACQIADKIRLVSGHCDPTLNLYDWYVGIRSNRVEQLWPMAARGAVY